MRALARGIGLSLAGLAVLFNGAPAAVSPGTDTIAVTYVGNEGFLIKAGGSKALIGALYREGVPEYVVHPVERRDAMEGARPPFDRIDLVLATHSHADHFGAGAVAAHLRSNPEAVFVSTPQAATQST